MTADLPETESPLRRLIEGTSGAVVLLLLVVICYAMTAQFGYIWDDDTYVVNNTHLRDFAGLSRMWTHVGATPQYYPVTFTSFWMEYQLFGLNPGVSHVVNLLLHAGSVLLLWTILKGLRVPGAWLAAAIFAVHPIHVESVAWITERKNTLSLAFGLSALLVYLRYAGLIAKPQAAPKPTIKTEDGEEEDDGGVDLSLPDDPKRLYALFIILFLCALLSKTTLSVLPGVILVIVWWKNGKLTLKDVTPLIAPIVLGLGAGMLTSWIEQHPYIVGARGPAWEHGILDRLALAGQVSWFYVGKLLLPHPFAWGLPAGTQLPNPPVTLLEVPEGIRAFLPWSLMFNYPKWDLNAANVLQWVGTISMASVVGVLWAMRQRLGRGALACVLLYLGCLVPAMGLVNVYPMRFAWVADHFAYVASIGLTILFAAGVTRLFRHVALAPVLGVLLVGYLASVTILHGLSFKDFPTIWSDTLLRNHNSWLSAASLGGYWRTETENRVAMIEFAETKEQEELAKKKAQDALVAAERWLAKAGAMNPDSYEVPFQLAMIERARGNFGKAMALALDADRIAAEQGSVQYIYPRRLLASLLVQKGEPEQAEQILGELREKEPLMGDKIPATFAEARMLSATLSRKRLKGRISPSMSQEDGIILGQAIDHLVVATELTPHDPKPRLELARILIELERLPDAIEQANLILMDNKNDADAKMTIAMAAMKGKSYQIAGAQLANLIQQQPRHLPAYVMLAEALEELKQEKDAIRELETALKINPNYIPAKNMLARLTGATTQPATTQSVTPQPTPTNRP